MRSGVPHRLDTPLWCVVAVCRRFCVLPSCQQLHAPRTCSHIACVHAVAGRDKRKFRPKKKPPAIDVDADLTAIAVRVYITLYVCTPMCACCCMYLCVCASVWVPLCVGASLCVLLCGCVFCVGVRLCVHQCA